MSDAPRAVDVCPHAKHCQHRATSTIGRSGSCPDCGTQVYGRTPTFRTGTRGAGSFLAQERHYHGGWVD